MFKPGESGFQRCLEGEPRRAERRATVTGGFVSYFGYVAIQTGAHLHSGRGRCGSRSLAHAEHRPDAQSALQTFPGQVHSLALY